jgi:hypothetical protein
MRGQMTVAGRCAAGLAVVMLGGWMAVAAGQQARPRPAASPAPARSGAALKTAWGAPDLNGFWDAEFGTPLERNPALGQRELFTDQERAAITKAANDARVREEQGFRRGQVARGTEQDVQGGYDIYFDTKPASRFTSLIIDPPDGRVPPFTPEAERKAKVQREFEVMLLQATSVCKTGRPECAGGQYGPVSPRYYDIPPYYVSQSHFAGGLNRAVGPEDMDLRTRCLLPPMPNWSGPLRLVQSRNAISLTYEGGQSQSWIRTIPITDRPHVPANVRFWGGDSRARWEGDTLVVDVTNFDPRAVFPDDGGYAGRVGGARENLHLVEKYKRLDANTLQLVVTIEDPTTWTRPWTIRQELQLQSEQKKSLFFEPRCHEGNHGLIDIMSGARAVDKAFKEGKGPDPATICIAQCGGDREQR